MPPKRLPTEARMTEFRAIAKIVLNPTTTFVKMDDREAVVVKKG